MFVIDKMLHLFVIEGCPFCQNSLRLVKKHKFKADITVVQPQQKNQYKQRHSKNTFPHVFYKAEKNSKNMRLIGGNSEFESLLNALEVVREFKLPNNTVCNLLKDMK